MSRSSGRRFWGIPNEFWIGFVVMVGFFLKLVYVSKLGYAAGTLSPGVWQENADAARNGGALDVISYLYTFHHLPDFSPKGLFGFSEPPFYYITCSLWMELLHRLMRWSANVSLYCVLALNVIYVMVGECAGFGILQKLGVRGRKLVVAILFLIFFPAHYHMSASLSGSALCFMLTMLSFNGVLSWHRSRRKKVLGRSAVELGLALMTSYSAVIIVPAMVVIFVFATKDGRRNQTPLSVQFRNFALTAGIMGMIWPVYLSIRFGLPLFYVEGVGARLEGEYASAVRRLAVPGRSLMRHLHTVGDVSKEYNIWAQTFKTALADFHGINTSLRGTYLITMLLLYANVILSVLAHLMLGYTLFFANRIDRVFRRMLLIGYLSMLVAYIAACFIVPYTGTMDFKMIAGILIFPLAGMSVCGSGDLSDNRFEKVFTGITNVMILVMAFVTAFLFGFYY